MSDSSDDVDDNDDDDNVDDDVDVVQCDQNPSQRHDLCLTIGSIVGRRCLKGRDDAIRTGNESRRRRRGRPTNERKHQGTK